MIFKAALLKNVIHGPVLSHLLFITSPRQEKYQTEVKHLETFIAIVYSSCIPFEYNLKTRLLFLMSFYNLIILITLDEFYKSIRLW